MEPVVATRKAELIGDTLRRFVRRGARSNISKLLGKMRPEDVAPHFSRLMPDDQLAVFKVIVADYPENAGDVFTALQATQAQEILEGLEPPAIARMLEAMNVDDAVALMESLPSDLHDKLVEIVDLRDLDEVQTHLTYGDDTAGRLMNPRFFAVSETKTVDEAVSKLREAEEIDDIFYVYVVDEDGHLVGVTSLRQLLLASPHRILSETMSRSLIKVRTDTDQEEVAQLAARYNLLAVPVTDASNRLVGTVTLDDIIDVVEEEATEDFYKMVGTSDDELVYQDRSFRVAGIRLPWLLFNLAGLVLAGILIGFFETTLQDAIFLFAFVPAIMGMGGNMGSQTSTIAVRGIATGRLSLGDRSVRQFLWQQIKVGTILGIICASVVGVGAMVWEANPTYGLVVGVSLFIAVMLASVNGVIIPILFVRLGVDPAVAAGPLVTTSNDITGILIYFGLATIFIDLLIR